MSILAKDTNEWVCVSFHEDNLMVCIEHVHGSTTKCSGELLRDAYVQG